MAGHSKWSKIKRKKAANDQKTGTIFTRLLREVQVAAKFGGPSPDGNPRLRLAIQAAKAARVPNDNIERAIKRGAGLEESVNYEEMVYEAYGPAGVAFLIKALTDNKNRTVAEVRHAVNKCNGNLANSNAVAYLFNEKGIITVDKDQVSEEELFDLALDAGADDIGDQDEYWEIVCEPASFSEVQTAVDGLGKEYSADLQMVPDTTVKVTGKDAQMVIRLLDMLDDLDDVQSVSANFEMDDTELQKVQ